MVVAPVGTVLKRSLDRRNLGRYEATVDNFLRGGVSSCFLVFLNE